MSLNCTTHILSALLVIFSITTTISAETVKASSYAGGDGTKASPFQISNLAELRRLSETPSDWDKHFIQVADIDLSDSKNWNAEKGDIPPAPPEANMGFSPIGVFTQPFTGSYNGNGFEISNLYINRNAPEKVRGIISYRDYVGLFGLIEGAFIQNVNLTNVSITGGDSAGALIGMAVTGYENRGQDEIAPKVFNCTSSGTITDSRLAGGLIGKSEACINNSHSSCTLLNIDRAGGLIGEQYFTSITNSSSTGSIETSGVCAGGLIGILYGDNVINCYSTGELTMEASLNPGEPQVQQICGGLIGISSVYSTVKNCFSSRNCQSAGVAGGLVGSFAGKILNSYSSGNISGDSGVGGLIGSLTTSQNNHFIKDSYTTCKVSGTSYVGSVVGMLGENLSTIENCFYEAETTAFSTEDYQNGNAGDLPDRRRDVTKLTAEAFNEYDFSTVWNMLIARNVNEAIEDFPWVHGKNETYPRLYWQFGFSSFEIFENSEEGLELLRQELIELGIRYIIDENLSDYQVEILNNLELVMDLTKTIQQVVNNINSQDGFTHSTLELCKGWNLISCPFENWSIEDSSELQTVSPLFLFSFKDDGYEKCKLSMNLEPKKAYWLYVEGLKKGETRYIPIKGKTPEDSTVNLEVGWNMVGTIMMRNFPN